MNINKPIDSSNAIILLAVDVNQAAILLWVSGSTIRKLMRNGELIPSYIEDKPILPIKELEQYLATRPQEYRHRN